MSLLHLILRGLWQHRRMHLAVALGVAVATAVLAGALLVGDSMRGSLRQLAVERLGRVDQAVVGERFFRPELVGEVAQAQPTAAWFEAAEPAILLQGTVALPEGNRRAGRVVVLGCREAFWNLARDGDALRPVWPPGDDGIVLNQTLADRLGLGVNAEVLLRLARPSAVSRDSLLAHKSSDETIESRRLVVRAIVPARGLGRFDLRFSQQESANAFVSLATLQDMLGQPGLVNTLLLPGKADEPAPADVDAAVKGSLRPTLADLGLMVKRVQRSHAGRPVLDYVDVTSDRMLLPPAVESALDMAFPQATRQSALTYLANSMVKRPGTGSREPAVGQEQPKARDDVANKDDGAERTAERKVVEIPYSTVTALVPNDALGPFTSDVDGRPVGPLGDDEIVLTSWVRDDLRRRGVDLRTGDAITLRYFEPETTHGDAVERSHTFRLKTIVALAEPGETPLRTNDPDLTPTVPGVTDKDTIANWEAPFPYDSTRVRREDEDYWKQHRATPKAFVSLATGRKLWASRFGETTSVRLAPGPGVDVDAVSTAILRLVDPADLGIRVLPVRRQALAAATGTTSFTELFLGFSMFVIAAAVLLVALLFRLGVERRVTELGVLLAVGWPRRRAVWLFVGEGLLAAAIGAALGVPLGIGYAQLLLAGLMTWWVDAIGTPFLAYYSEWSSLLMGYVSGVLVAAATIVWTLWRMRSLPVRGLLSGRIEDRVAADRGTNCWSHGAVAVSLVLAAALGWLGSKASGEGQAAAFFGSGVLVLIALLMEAHRRLRSSGRRGDAVFGRWPLLQLATRNNARNPSRSVLTIGLVAAATFVIVAIGAFRQSPTEAGVGGFTLIAESDLPLLHDLATPAGRQELGFDPDRERLLKDCEIVSFRVRSGDDASCLNLYRPRQPRVLGAPAEIAQIARFEFANRLREHDAATAWDLLEDASPTPVILDAATATYSLQLALGDEFPLEDGHGATFRCRIVGLLKNSILQGDVLMSEASFRRHFSDESGRRLFLVRTSASDAASVAAALEETLGDWGLSTQRTDVRLAALLAVQNTYLSTFQSLGALGLLLGTFGLATVQLRNALDRRAELALLHATGFPRRRLGTMVLVEAAALLLGALVIGIVAALVAVLPHLLAGGAAVPWRSLAAMLATIIAVGLAAALAAVRATLAAATVATLRGD